jgi:hypothetical protein
MVASSSHFMGLLLSLLSSRTERPESHINRLRVDLKRDLGNPLDNLAHPGTLELTQGAL